MDSKRVLFFLELLNRETNGHADEIAKMYKRALDENDDVVHLKMFIDDFYYYHERGRLLLNLGEDLVSQIYSMPLKSLELLPQLKQAHKSIENEVRHSNELMHSPFPFSEIITVLRKKDIIAYKAALKMIASVSVYLVALYAGLRPIQNLTWDDSVGIQERIDVINTKFLPVLCGVQRPNYCWVIRKKSLGGKALFGGNCFYLSYENTKSVETFCSALHKEPIGTHAFFSIDAFDSGECDVPFCWGIGNIVSVLPDNALLLLQNDVMTKVRSPQGKELKQTLPTPPECIRQLTDGMMYCITPDELLLAMNQWQIGHEIEERKKAHKCLFCGKHVDGNRMVCDTHFISEL